MACRILVSVLAGAAFALATTSAGAMESRHAATLDEVLAMQTFGSASLSPDGRWAVWEHRAAYDTAPRFDRGVRSGMATTSLSIASVDGDGAAEPLAPAGDEGLLLGPWSPDSRRLVVYRWRLDTLELGIVDLRTRLVRWTGLTPDLGVSGVATAWTSCDDLAVTVRPDAELPWPFRFEGTGQEVASARWLRTAQGDVPSRTAFETADGAARVDDGPRTPRRLLLIDAATGLSRALYAGAIRDIAPSPDGQWIAVVEAGERTPLPPEERAVQSAIQTLGRLTFIEIGNGRAVRPPSSIDIAPHLLSWSPDSRQALVWARTEGVWADGGLVAVSPIGRTETFAANGLTPAEEGRTIDELRPVRAAWLDGRPILYARKPAGRFDWWMLGGAEPIALTRQLESAPARIAARIASGDGGGALIIADGAVWKMTSTTLDLVSDHGVDLRDAEPGDARAALRLRVNTPPVRKWAIVSDAVSTAVIDQAGAPFWRAALAPCAGSARTLAVAQRAVLRLCLDQGRERLDLVNASGARILDQLNTGFGELAVAQAIPHRDRDGRRVQSYLYLPQEGTASTAVKGLIVHLYPGGGDSGRHIDGNNLHMGPRPQLLAMGGYAVLSVSIPSERESRRAQMFDDFTHGVDLALDAALAAVPSLPRDRVAIVGHSFGGYAALGVATRSARFRAYAVWAAPTDMIGKWGEFLPQARTWPDEGLSLNQSMGSVETGQGGLGAPPWDAIDAYAAASPALLAEHISAPVLLITADRDYVPVSQAERLFTALHRLGKPARMVVYWGEGHDNASPANIRDVYGEIFSWLDRALAPFPTDGLPKP